jgi:hypothetical protein
MEDCWAKTCADRSFGEQPSLCWAFKFQERELKIRSKTKSLAPEVR